LSLQSSIRIRRKSRIPVKITGIVSYSGVWSVYSGGGWKQMLATLFGLFGSDDSNGPSREAMEAAAEVHRQNVSNRV